MVQSASYSLWIGTATFHHVATFAIVKAAPESRLFAVAQLQTFACLLTRHMPVASPPMRPRTPSPLSQSEVEFIKQTIQRYYGTDAVIRNFGPDPNRLEVHVETDAENDMRKYDCLGVLLTRIDRAQISLEVTSRGEKPRGSAKLAYRQGMIL